MKNLHIYTVKQLEAVRGRIFLFIIFAKKIYFANFFFEGSTRSEEFCVFFFASLKRLGTDSHVASSDSLARSDSLEKNKVRFILTSFKKTP